MLEDLEKTLKKVDEHGENIKYLLKEVANLKNQTAIKQSLTVKEAAAHLGVKPTTVRTWIASGKLKATNTGKTLLVHADSITKFLKAKQ